MERSASSQRALDDGAPGTLWERQCTQMELGTSVLTIDAYQPRDVTAVACLAHTAFDGSSDGAPLEAWVRKVSAITSGRYGTFLPDASFVIRQDDAQLPVGVALVTDFPLYEAPVVALICVVPSQQCRGMGGTLLRMCVHHLALSGFNRCRAKISLTNEASRRLFQSQGFREVKRVPHAPKGGEPSSDE
ncbi:GNAT family N-acetyltransferase [Bordetella genomosp. 1]|uniref:N-acetyltransferase domain-containing protein n=1 Tax=Bordetella genomosp. 1 TaxID=1395607 RepID=A0ABX4EWW7_9BORD|nr:GNAT family N-acetyltransferase [Bordetella genomosp. 1]OZI58970.1 hypothetical protein CAL27_20115 [Bordetella genomosp. 1]